MSINTWEEYALNKITSKNKSISKPQDNTVVKDIVNIIYTVQAGALRAINIELIKRNWLIGKRINEEILTNRSNDYGKGLIKNLSFELSKYGSGFSRRNLYRYLVFYRLYQNILPTPLSQSKDNGTNILDSLNPKSFLPWTHYVLLMQIKDKKERDWYENEASKYCWSFRQLQRNIKTDYYHRVLSNQIEHKTNEIATINQNDYLKSIYIFEFLNLKHNYKESDLEQALINHLKDFMLELGKGYSFVGRQVHLRTNNQDYYVDLVFYNTILKCNVLIDLKIGKITHKDIGQMQLYLKLYDSNKNKDDNPSIGIVLSSDTNGDVVKYLTTNSNIVSSKYLTYLPTKQQLLKEINKTKQLFM